MKLANLYREIEPDHTSDPWGYSTGLLFDLCEYLGAETNIDPTSEDWGFSPSPLGYNVVVVDEYRLEIFREQDAETLVALGDFLHRYTNMLEHTGNGY